jgi:hypothetical protein
MQQGDELIHDNSTCKAAQVVKPVWKAGLCRQRRTFVKKCLWRFFCSKCVPQTTA